MRHKTVCYGLLRANGRGFDSEFWRIGEKGGGKCGENGGAAGREERGRGHIKRIARYIRYSVSPNAILAVSAEWGGRDNKCPPEKAAVAPFIRYTRDLANASSGYAVFTAPPVFGDRRRRARSDADKRGLYFKALGVACTPPPAPSPRGEGALLFNSLRENSTGEGWLKIARAKRVPHNRG